MLSDVVACLCPDVVPLQRQDGLVLLDTVYFSEHGLVLIERRLFDRVGGFGELKRHAGDDWIGTRSDDGLVVFEVECRFVSRVRPSPTSLLLLAECLIPHEIVNFEVRKDAGGLVVREDSIAVLEELFHLGFHCLSGVLGFVAFK